MRKYWYWFFVAAMVLAALGPGAMPFSIIFIIVILGYAAILLFVLKTTFKNPRRMIEKHAKRKRLSGNYFEIIGKNPERFRKLYLFPFAGAITGLALINVVLTIAFATIADSRPEFLQFLPEIVSNNQGFAIAYLIMFVLLILGGVILFLFKLYSTSKIWFRDFGEEINNMEREWLRQMSRPTVLDAQDDRKDKNKK